MTSTESILTRVRALAPAIAARSAEIEAAGTMPADLVAALGAAGCFRMLVPEQYGGEALSLSEALRVIEAVSRADGSAGWTVMIGGSAPLLAAFLPRETIDEIYSVG